MSGVQTVAISPALTFAGMAARYAVPLQQVTDEILTLADRVKEHIKVGVTWK
jgi:hypothetical protein